jgi:hypothetical protein
MYNNSEEKRENAKDTEDSAVELCLRYDDYLNILNDPYFYLESLDKFFYENIARNSDEVYKNFKLLNREVQLNISFNDLGDCRSFEKNEFDSLNLCDFIPAFSYLKRLILNQYPKKNKFYLKEDKYLFLIREKSNICDSVDYENCEERNHNGRKIFNPPFHRNERWTTFYLINAYEINPNMNKDEILDFLNNQQD